MNTPRLFFVAVLTASTVLTASIIGRAADPPAAAEAERPRTVQVLRVDGTSVRGTIVSGDASALRLRTKEGVLAIALGDVRWIEVLSAAQTGHAPEYFARLEQDFAELLAQEPPRIQEELRKSESELLWKASRPIGGDRWHNFIQSMHENRSKAWIPLILRAMADDQCRVKRYAYLLQTLETFCGEPIPKADIGVVVRDWWFPRRDKLTVDPARMSPEQREFIVGRLLEQAASSRTYESRSDGTVGSLYKQLQYGKRTPFWTDMRFVDPLPTLLMAACDKPATRLDALFYLADLRRIGRMRDLAATARDAGASPGKRIMAAAAVSMVDRITLHEVLIPFVRAEIDQELKTIAVLVLGHSRNPAAVETIVALLHDPKSELYEAALWATSDQQAPAALAVLAERLRSDLRNSVELPKPVIETLGRIHTPESADILAEAMDAGLRSFPESDTLRYLLDAFESAVGRQFNRASQKPADIQAAVRLALAARASGK